MSRASAGIFIEMNTDSNELVIELGFDEQPSGTSSVLEYVPRSSIPLDGCSCEIGKRLTSPSLESGLIGFSILELENESSTTTMLPLPGFGSPHNVRIWLPCLRGCTIGRIWGDGTTMEPVASRQQLLIFGDSISQGFVAGNPALSWPSLLAKKLGFDVVNQGIGGQVFQPTTLPGLARTIELAAIIVEFGANYRYERCSRQEVARDIRIYLEELSQLWADVPCWVLTPLWHNENVWPTNPASCFSDVPAVIAESTKVHPAMHLVEGTDLLDSDSTFFADGFEHPNAAGSEQIATRLAKIMKPALAGEHDI
jgi:hypothetical protein